MAEPSPLGPPRQGRQPEGAQGGVAPVDGEAALREQRAVGLVEGAPAEVVAHGVEQPLGVGQGQPQPDALYSLG